MHKYLYFTLIILILGCNNKNTNEIVQDLVSTKIESEGIPVTLSIVEPSAFSQQIISNGHIEALQKTELRFKTSERISTVNIKNGQNVTKGQTLGLLDNAILANQLNKNKIEVDKAKSKLLEEKINYGISISKVNTIDASILKNLKIKSGLYEAENGLENAQLLYNQTVIKAPFSGIIANMEMKTGDFITSSDVFCTLINPNNLEVVFFVIENDLEFLFKNQKVSITQFADISKVYEGAITEINPLVDENGLVQIRARLNNADNSLFDGMNVKLIISKAVEDVIVIPKEALVLRSNREVVFSYENGLAKWNYVKILDENSDSYALKEGIKLGDTLIISGNMNLAHDARVKPTNTNN